MWVIMVLLLHDFSTFHDPPSVMIQEVKVMHDRKDEIRSRIFRSLVEKCTSSDVHVGLNKKGMNR